MNTIVTILLFFIDTNLNNTFDSQDRFINTNVGEIVYCITSDTKEVKPCGYIENNDSNIIDVVQKEYVKNKEQAFLNEEYFSSNSENAIGNLILGKSNGKYILDFKDSKRKYEEKLYYTSTPDVENNMIKDIGIKGLVVVITIFTAWLVLFPKKTVLNDKR